MIEENGVTRTKKYEELSVTEKIQADCDLKGTYNLLQGLPSDVNSLVNHHRISKDLWGKVQLLILPPEWSKFVTDVKLVRYLHTTNFDQLHAYLKQHEVYANEVRIMSERNQYPLAISPQYGLIHPTQHYSTTYPSTPHAITYPSTSHPNAYSSTVHQDACPQPQYILQIEYTVSIVNQQPHLTEFPQIDSSLAERQISLAAGTSRIRADISGIGRNNSGKQRVVKCFNYKGEGHMERQCPKPKRKRDATWFRDKVLLVKAQGSGKVLNEEELEFLVETRVAKGPVTQTIITHNAAYQANDLDAYDYDCDDFSTAKAILMANLSRYGSDVLSEVPHSKNTHTDMLNQSVKEMSYSEQTHLVNYPENEITSDSNILPYSQYLLETQNAAIQVTNSSAQQDAMILSVFEQLSNQVTNCNKVNNQLRNSSKPRHQATIHNGRVIVQPIQERQISLAAGTSRIRADISGIGRNNSGKQRVVKCFNYKGEGHMERQCPKPKRKRDATWFRDKVLLVKAQGSGKVLNEEELEFLVETRVAKGPVTQTIITHNAAYQANDLDAYDYDCDDFSTAKAILMANLSRYGSDVLSEIRPTLYDGSVIAKETNVISIVDYEDTLMLEEESRSKMLLKQSDQKVLEKKVIIKATNYAELNRLSKDFGKRFISQQELSNEEAFRLQTSHHNTD
nr:hypothetical protein [Tanacetum cinerariifolium]